MTTISELIAWLEGASEGSRELDAMIAVAINFVSPERSKPNPLPTIVPRSWRQMDAEYGVEYLIECINDDRSVWSVWIPRYSSSVDAALTLIPDGRFLEMQRYSDGWYVKVRKHSTEAVIGQADQKPLALAICIAALRVRQS